MIESTIADALYETDGHRAPEYWKVLVVDDEKEVHTLTKMVLDDVVFQGKKIELLFAFTAGEAIDVMQAHPDIALVILDVVMETDDAGLKFVRHIRKQTGNRIVQIVLRTGQPGLAPPQKIIEEYDINSYSSKIELTSQRIYTMVIASLRAYDLAASLQKANEKLQFEIEQRKKAEEEINRLNRFQKIVIDNAGIWLDVSDANEKVVMWNKAAERISGYKKSEIYDKAAFYRRLYPNMVYRRAVIERIDSDDADQEMETLIKCRDGSSRNMVWNIHTLYDESQSVEIGTITLGRDVTEKKHMENQLLQSGKMEAVGRMAGGIAHDFNNILTVIQGHCELLLARLASGDPLYDKIEQIESAAEKAGRLTRQLLSFSRHRVSRPAVVCVNSLVTDMMDMLGRMAGKRIRILTRFQDEIPCIKADPGQIEQVVMNLVINAVDAMDGNGQITLATHLTDTLPVGSATPVVNDLGHGYVTIKVKDSGGGIDERIVDKIFEPFFTTKPRGKGTGLGLSIVYGAVRRNGGDITVDTFPGNGTEFAVCFPALDPTLKSEPASDSRSDKYKGKETILVVDDQAEVLELTTETLNFYGYNVYQASGAAVAFKQFEEPDRHFDLVLTDIEMDEMNGVRLAGKLKQKYPELKVLFMSGYAEQGSDYGERIEPGINFIEKPFSAKKLLKMVRKLLE